MHTHTHTHANLSLDDNCVKGVLKFGSGLATCELANDVLHIGYAGGINLKTFKGLDAAVKPLRSLAPVALERMDKAFTVTGTAAVCFDSWPVNTPPSAVIVRADQYLFSVAFAAQLAERGILRMTYLPHELHRALQFVQLFPSTH